MKQRIITGAVGFAFLACIIYLGQTAFFITILLVNGCSLYEYAATIGEKKSIPDIVIFVASGTLLLLCGAYRPAYLTVLLVAEILLLFIKDILLGSSKADKSVYEVWGLIYISFFLALACKLLMSAHGLFLVTMLMLACMGCDMFAYFVGIRMGKHKLCPEISPKKSVEGSVAGFIGAVLICVVFWAIRAGFGAQALPLWFFLLSGVVLGVVGQFGDLAASMVKRKFGAKDYSNVLPGHGGFLDRIDSILFGAAAMYVLIALLL